MSHARSASAHGVVVAERPHDAHDVGVLEEDQPAVAVVVGERAERLRSQGDLRIERQPAVEHRGATASVDAAHPVDRDLLDEQLLLDELRRRRRSLGVDGRRSRCRFHGAAERTGARRPAPPAGRAPRNPCVRSGRPAGDWPVPTRRRRAGAPCSPCCGPTPGVGPSSARSWRPARRWRSPARSSCGAIVDQATDGADARRVRRASPCCSSPSPSPPRCIAVVVTRYATVTAWGTTNELRLRMTRHVLGLDHEFHRRHTPGELIQRVDGDVTSVSDFLGAGRAQGGRRRAARRRDARRAHRARLAPRRSAWLVLPRRRRRRRCVRDAAPGVASRPTRWARSPGCTAASRSG